MSEQPQVNVIQGKLFIAHRNISVVENNIIARLSQGLWTTTPRDFYQTNNLNRKCVVELSFNS